MFKMMSRVQFIRRTQCCNRVHRSQRQPEDKHYVIIINLNSIDKLLLRREQ